MTKYVVTTQHDKCKGIYRHGHCFFVVVFLNREDKNSENERSKERIHTSHIESAYP